MKSSQKNYLHRDLSDLRRTGKDHGSNHVLSPSLIFMDGFFILKSILLRTYKTIIHKCIHRYFANMFVKLVTFTDEFGIIKEKKSLRPGRL